MPRFFIDYIPGETAVIYGEDARHIAGSLRMREGEELTLCDMRGTDYRCSILRADNASVEVAVAESAPSRSEVACSLRLYQALPKGDKLEFIVQKATELGVAEIVPVVTARCISRPLARSMEKKTVRLQKIACEAAKQSGRGRVPQILPMMGFAEALEDMKRSQLALLFYEEGTVPLRGHLNGQSRSIALMVGSEGGFSAKEAEAAAAAGVGLASLGNRILRCETAPICALSAILYHLGEF